MLAPTTRGMALPAQRTRRVGWLLACCLVQLAGPLGAQDAMPSRSAGVASADGPYLHDDAPIATAVRRSAPIDIDGRLVEADWAASTPVSEFVQEIPREGEPGTQRTEVHIVYDEDAIYIGAMLWDDAPLTALMSRRDQGRSGFDYFRVSLDSFHDHETTYDFFVSPTGSYRDAVAGVGRGGGGGRGGGRGGAVDASWDPVWTRAAQVTSEGWSLEMRIPFSQLRFSGDPRQVWGVHLTRNIHRAQERTVFPFVPTLARGGPSRYAHLLGLEQLDTGRRMELLPYAAARAEYVNVTDPGVGFGNPYAGANDHSASVGVDLKYRLASNITLDASVNPDFGQVELDPSVINLTAFETRFDEVRPFFVEGADIFNLGEGGPGGSTGRPPQLLYSRRIGRAPQGSAPPTAVFDDAAGSTTILGAAKVTGRTASGWSLGFLEAVTNQENARYVDGSQVPGEVVIEPMTNYLVGRVRRQLGGGETRFGTMGTAVHRRLGGSGMEGALHRAAYSGGFDLAHEWSNRTYRISAAVSGSYVEGSNSAVTATQRSSTHYFQRPDAAHLELRTDATSMAGYYAMTELAKQAGAFSGRAAVALTSPGYEVNDLGFQSASDRVVVDTNLQYTRPTPGRVFRNWSVAASPNVVTNYAGQRVHSEASGSFNFQLLNYWSGGVRLAYNPVGDDDRLTRGGPMAEAPARFNAAVDVGSDTRKAFVARLTYARGRTSAGGWNHDFALNLTANASELVDLSFQPNLTRRYEVAQYITSVADSLASTYGRRYVFADLNQTTLSLATRVNVTLSPTLSVQLYLEPFVSAGDYGALKEFAMPKSFSFLTYGEDVGAVTQLADGRYAVDPDGTAPAATFNVANRDFSVRSMLGNAVMRWEWRQGSTLFLVWQHRRIDSLTNRGIDGTDYWVGQFDLGRDMQDMFSAPADNIFVIKMNYWLNP